MKAARRAPQRSPASRSALLGLALALLPCALASGLPFFGGGDAASPPPPCESPPCEHTAPGICPLPHGNGPEECTSECEHDSDCDDDELCCPYGCKRLCRKGTLPPHLHPISVIFVLILVCGWIVACGNLSSKKSAGG